MQIILDHDEAWSIMTLVVSQIVDGADLSKEGKEAVRGWRADRGQGTVEMDEIAWGINETLGTVLDERTTKLLRRRGKYISSKDEMRG